MVEEKKVTKIGKIRSRLASGWRDVAKLATDSGASEGTVRVQMYKWYKENPDKRPIKEKKTKPVKEKVAKK